MKWKWEWPDIAERVMREKQNLMNLTAATIQTQRGLIFDTEGKYNGRPGWVPSQRVEKHGGMTLSKSGALRRSIAPKNDGVRPGRDQGTVLIIEGSKVTVGTNLIYAAIHNFGGTINHPGTRNGFGRGIKIKPHKIHIKKRTFMDYNEQDKEEVQQTLVNAMVAIINGD